MVLNVPLVFILLNYVEIHVRFIRQQVMMMHQQQGNIYTDINIPNKKVIYMLTLAYLATRQYMLTLAYLTTRSYIC